MTPSSDIFHITDSSDPTTVHYAPFAFHEDDDGALSSESECILSDPSGYRSPPEFVSPERRVQFVDGNEECNGGPKDEAKEKRHKKR